MKYQVLFLCCKPLKVHKYPFNVPKKENVVQEYLCGNLVLNEFMYWMT
ncbi:hypothetical protein [Cellulophaga fucicola]|uniref:Uncharacterized protein n=1 Tax=Cellulophaga fucicola TaxID=76595 RepID=A0A1K1MES4_9FLAO|nr:hypothetical protein [Cellulophaga fucicola]SFW20454.1 hypothetical protein SAMN05660313_00485 [Cellulophaga fucicola]